MTITPPASPPGFKPLSIRVVERSPIATLKQSHAEFEVLAQKDQIQRANMVDANVSSSPTRAQHSDRSSPAEGPSSRTDMSPQAPANGATIGEARGIGTGLGDHDSRKPLEVYDWKNLEERFDVMMEERQVAEND
ncbi:MAG: hypothetical protein M1830_006830, partial [Pleopsidium flavum]